MDKRIPAGLVVLAALTGGAYTYVRFMRTPQVAPAAATVEPARPAEDSAIRFPMPEASGTVAPLPSLGASDSLAQSLLGELFGSERLATLFQRDELIRRFVATVDSLPRSSTAQQVIPLQPVNGAFAVSETAGGTFAIDARNDERYVPYVQLAEAADVETVVATYVRLYPLFQSAYEELGYPGKYFNDRLVVAIDDLLDAPEVSEPVLVQPKALYQFADPDLEARSSGQKIMIRMGPANARRVKVRLRALRAELTRNAPGR